MANLNKLFQTFINYNVKLFIEFQKMSISLQEQTERIDQASATRPCGLHNVEGACRILIEQAFPITEQMNNVGYVDLRKKKLERELKRQSKELIKTQKNLVAAQEELLNIQMQLLEKREVEITAVQSTAQKEMKSFASVLEKEWASALAPKKIQSAIVAASEDRGTLEEREERKKLVIELKEKAKQSPGTHYIIRGNRVLEAPRDS
eukprot:sb/3470448/